MLLLLLIKRYQLLKEETNVSFDDLMLFLDKFYFEKDKLNKSKLIKFIQEDNNKEIIDFLWTESIINPNIYNEKYKKN